MAVRKVSLGLSLRLTRLNKIGLCLTNSTIEKQLADIHGAFLIRFPCSIGLANSLVGYHAMSKIVFVFSLTLELCIFSKYLAYS